MTKPSILCRLGYHAWGAPKQGEMSAEARDVLTAAARHFPPGTVFRDGVTPWFQTCSRCGRTEQS